MTDVYDPLTIHDDWSLMLAAYLEQGSRELRYEGYLKP